MVPPQPSEPGLLLARLNPLRATRVDKLLPFACLALVLASALAFAALVRGVASLCGLLALTCAGLAVESMRREAGGRDRELRTLTLANDRLREANEALAGMAREGERVRRDNERVIFDLARSNGELDQFAYVTSHDLKAPLRGISNLAAWIEEDAAKSLSEASRAHLRLMQLRVARMDALIEGLLAYSRAGRVVAELEQVDVEELVHEIVEIATLPADARIDIDRSLPLLLTQRVPLQLVLTNLIVNAAQHGRGAGGLRIRVSAERADAAWVLCVADDGPGIPAGQHARIFGLFETLEAQGDRVAGLGLAIVSKTVQSRGGWVEVDSEVGRGARFRFSWPDPAPGPEEIDTAVEASCEDRP